MANSRRGFLKTLGAMLLGVAFASRFRIKPVFANPAKHGNTISKFPPSNDGAAPGAGQIEETINGVPQGKPYFVFHTPDDNNGVEFEIGTAVTFDAIGQKATNVQRDEV